MIFRHEGPIGVDAKRGLVHMVKDKRKPGRVLSISQKKRNRKYGAVRAKVEHVFRVIKCQFAYRKLRYRGLAKTRRRCSA